LRVNFVQLGYRTVADFERRLHRPILARRSPTAIPPRMICRVQRRSLLDCSVAQLRSQHVPRSPPHYLRPECRSMKRTDFRWTGCFAGHQGA
jgi:hypothetical protein